MVIDSTNWNCICSVDSNIEPVLRIMSSIPCSTGMDDCSALRPALLGISINPARMIQGKISASGSPCGGSISMGSNDVFIASESSGKGLFASAKK